jgi:metallo-beta-lactamase family protein
MELTFLGGASTVTGSQYLLETASARVVIDCGLFQGSPNEVVRNRVPLGYDPATVDAILLTHAHLDHCGLLPVVVREGFAGPIYATTATVELASLVLRDSGRLQQESAERSRRRRRGGRGKGEPRGARREVATSDALEAASGARGASGRDGGGPHDADPEAALRAQPAELEAELDEPLYTEADALLVEDHLRGVAYGREIDVAPGIAATFVDAGHILGSAIIVLQVREAPAARTIVFSGDLGRPGTPILRDPTVLDRADVVVVESTYGGRAHEPQAEAVDGLVDAVRTVVERDGVLLIPAFAIGRTQEIVWVLDRLVEAGRIPLIPLYLDSPMASAASGIYRRHTDAYDAPTRRLLELGATPLDYPRQVVTNDVARSRAIARARRPHIIVASSGMLTGGRVVHHLERLIDDPRSVLLFVGYQGEGTLGDHLQAGARTVRLGGVERPVRCEIRTISGFSAHADEAELMDWLAHLRRDGGGAPGSTASRPRAFIVHGDPGPQRIIAARARALGFDVTIPRWRERFGLD